jgi:hypothetical protein
VECVSATDDTPPKKWMFSEAAFKTYELPMVLDCR